MPNELKDIFTNSLAEKPVAVAASFDAAMSDKIAERVADKRISVAQDMVGAVESSGEE